MRDPALFFSSSIGHTEKCRMGKPTAMPLCTSEDLAKLSLRPAMRAERLTAVSTSTRREFVL